MGDAATLRSVLKALSGDEVVDWDAAESRASHHDSQLLLQELRVIAQISAAHASEPVTASGARVLPFTLDPGTRWGTLRLLALLGTGADGAVYRAYDERLQREVALKLLRRLPDDRGVSGVLDEARLLARLRHPNVVTVHGADVVDRQAGIWMELVDGETLQAQVLRQGRFGADEAALVGAEICRGLAAIHQAGILHRDLKAQNVMRESGGRIVIMDFSVSRAGGSQRPGLAGTPMYLAPELFTGAPASSRSDIYGVGVLLYYLVTGTYPINGASVAEVALAHESRRGTLLRDVRADLPAAFVTAVDRALSHDPALRPASAGELEAALLQSLTRQKTDRVGGLSRVRRRGWIVGTVAAAMLVLAASVWSVWPSRGKTPSAAVPLEARPWVLVAAFDNRTGNPDLDGVLEGALERELVGSAQFRVASRPRVDDVLRLMQRPIDSSLHESIAREVALRDGGIRSMIAGRIEQVGSITVLSASVIDVAGGASVASVSEEASGPAGLQVAVRQLSNRLRRALGEKEASIRLSAQALERVTTPSLEALRLYTEAYAAGERDHWPAALNLAKAAVQEDPDFAAAHTWLAWAMFRNQLPREQYLVVASTAVSLSNNTSEWERLWINASYYSLSGDAPRAQGAYEALLRLYPDHFWGANNLVILHRRAGRDAEAFEPAMRLVELRPRDYNALYVAFDSSRRLGKLEQAAGYAHRIKASGVYNRQPSGDAWVFDAVLAWHHKKPDALVQELRKVQADALLAEQELRNALVARASILWLAAGRPADAQSALRLAAPTAERHLAQAALAHAIGDRATARQEALAANILDVPSGGTNAAEVAQWVLAMWLTGRNADVRETMNLYLRLEPSVRRREAPAGPATANVLAAELAHARGDTLETIRRLTPQSAWNVLSDAANFRAAETLAEAFVTNGNHQEAARALEKALASRHFGASDAAYWQMRCQLRLAEVYQHLGRTSEATTMARELERILSEADPGFPMVERVRAIIDGR